MDMCPPFTSPLLSHLSFSLGFVKSDRWFGIEKIAIYLSSSDESVCDSGSRSSPLLDDESISACFRGCLGDDSASLSPLCLSFAWSRRRWSTRRLSRWIFLMETNLSSNRKVNRLLCSSIMHVYRWWFFLFCCKF